MFAATVRFGLNGRMKNSAATVNKNKMKKTIIVLSLVILLSAPLARAQTIPISSTSSTSEIQLAIQNSLITLLNLLLQRLAELQAQLAELQKPQQVATGAPAAAISLPADEYPVIKFFVDNGEVENTDVSNGEHKIQWLATQKNKHEMTCSSPEIGKVGTGGVTIRNLSVGTHVFNFTCRDNVTFVETAKTLTIRILQ